MQDKHNFKFKRANTLFSIEVENLSLVHWYVTKAKIGILCSRIISNFVKTGRIKLLHFIKMSYIEDVIR